MGGPELVKPAYIILERSLGCFFKIFKILIFVITQLVKKLQQWSSDEVIEDILPFVLNTKRLLSDIRLLRYKQNSFGCFAKNIRISLWRGLQSWMGWMI